MYAISKFDPQSFRPEWRRDCLGFETSFAISCPKRVRELSDQLGFSVLVDSVDFKGMGPANKDGLRVEEFITKPLGIHTREGGLRLFRDLVIERRGGGALRLLLNNDDTSMEEVRRQLIPKLTEAGQAFLMSKLDGHVKPEVEYLFRRCLDQLFGREDHKEEFCNPVVSVKPVNFNDSLRLSDIS